MSLIFKKEHIELILQGKKTQTRRTHRHSLRIGGVYDIKVNYYQREGHKICILRRYKQRLGDITPEEALKEGGYTIEEYRKVWRRINGAWDPDQVVTVYEFRLLPRGTAR
jgi:hypothetical protein